MKSGESLRDELGRRYAAGGYFTLEESVAAFLPFVLHLANLHDQGKTAYVHPGSIRFQREGCTLDLEAATVDPTAAKDRACLAPEVKKKGAPGDARASVFACGAILYEMVTGESVGPSMRPPTELAPEVPSAFELMLGRALITDVTQRPADLRALAQALHHCVPEVPTSSPELDAEGAFDESFEIDLDVSMSLLPPPSAVARQSLLDLHAARAKSTPPIVAATVKAAPSSSSADASQAAPTSAPRSSEARPAAPSSTARAPRTATERLAELKIRLEADPRPRYVVIKDGMDHGPFTAVELLHQIATHSFTGEHPLLDTFASDERPIADWPEFAPFAEQAQRSVEAKTERKQLEASVTADSQRARVKTFVALGVGLVGLAALAGLYFRYGRKDAGEVVIRTGQAQNVDFEGSVAKGKGGGKSGGRGPGGRTSGGPGGVSGASDAGIAGDDGPANNGAGTPHPVLPGGLSCEGARSKYVEDYSKDAPPDLSAGAFGAVLNRGDYLNACGVPPSMGVSVCAAVQNGRAVGVTVTTTPPNGGIAGCISGQVRSMSFPSHPRLDITYTTFKAQ